MPVSFGKEKIRQAGIFLKTDPHINFNFIFDFVLKIVEP